MKKILSLCCILLIFGTFISAQESNDQETDTDDNFVYKMNGAGDQMINISLMGEFPLNFGDKLYTGGAAEIGYYRFLSSWFAFGSTIMFGYNPTIGSNIFTYIPVTLDFIFQPTLWKLEFPITLGVGGAYESYLGYNYFPGLILRPKVGIYYRVNDSWSAGIQCSYIYMPQWYINNSKYNDAGHFITAQIGARYHF